MKAGTTCFHNFQFRSLTLCFKFGNRASEACGNLPDCDTGGPGGLGPEGAGNAPNRRLRQKISAQQ